MSNKYFVYVTDGFDAHALDEFNNLEDALEYIERKKSNEYTCTLIKGIEIDCGGNYK